jgi:hypothetical protein
MKLPPAYRLSVPLIFLLGAQCGELPTDTEPQPQPQPEPQAPQAPAGLTATPVRAGEIELAWNDVAGETEFRIESRGGAGTIWLTEASLAANTASYRDTGVPAGTTLTYRVQACNGAGCSAFSPEATATATSPTAPSELTATAAVSGRIELVWKDNSQDETGFEVEYLSSPGTLWSRLVTTAPNVMGLAHLDLDAGDTYRYRVRACADAGCSAYSAEAMATVLAPAAPTDLRAQAVGSGRIDLRWKDNSGDETGFRIEYRSGSSVYWYVLANTPANDTAYAHAGLDARDTYAYRVRSCNASGCSEPTPEAQATAAPPAIPSALAATPVRSGRVNLAWQDNSVDETSFRIEYREAPSSYWYELTSVAANTTAHAHTGLYAGITYIYRMRSCNASGCSDASPEVQATVLGPLAPTSLVATTPSSGRVSLAWQDNSADETSFQLQYRSATSTYWSVLRNLAPDTRSFAHTDLHAGDSYVYRVRACNASGCSEDSNEITATVTGPAAPSSLAATSPASGRISVSWQDNSSEETSFQLQARSATSSYWSLVQNLPADTRTYLHANLQAGDSYVYRVRACNDAGCSDDSNEARATVRGPEAPSGLTATGTTGAISISWRDNSNDEDYFDLQGRPSESSYWSLSSKPAAGVTSHTHQGLTAGDAYVYRIRACNTSGCSPFSLESSATVGGTPSQPPPGPGPGASPSPSAPALTAPADGSETSLLTPTLSWQAVAGATRYRVMVAQRASALPTDASQNSCSGCEVIMDVTGTTLNPPAGALKPAVGYTWQVRAITAAGATGWSRRTFSTPLMCPSGWSVPEGGRGRGVLLCQREANLSAGRSMQYAVQVNLRRGARVTSLYQMTSGTGTTPSFQPRAVEEWWGLAGATPGAFCASNGAYFMDFDEDATELSFPLRDRNVLVTRGAETGERTKFTLRLYPDSASIRPYQLPGYAAETRIHSELGDAPAAVVSLAYNVLPAHAEGQTFAAVKDTDSDGHNEVVILYVTLEARRDEVIAILDGEFGVDTMLRFDAGPSSQLRCRTGLIARLFRIGLGVRPVPHALLVVEAP